jgi:exonuclease SbcC
LRPIRLALEGFTSFRDRLEIDFTGLDLFAVTGPTGAGKSSLIDAIVFALYGQVPRVGDDYKQLISHGADRLSVLFEFAVRDERFRIGRVVRRAGASQQRLERGASGSWEPVADRVKDIRTRVEATLGLDYDGFVRAVVLPQGQFDAFLKGEPRERRKILVALLGLGVYEKLLQLANARGGEARKEADFIARQLETDFAGASEEALAARRAELGSAVDEASGAEAALGALAEGASCARAAASARRDAEEAARGAKAEEARLAQAEATVADSQARLEALDAELRALHRKVDDLGFDEERLAALLGARPRIDQLADVRSRLARLRASVEQKRGELRAAGEDLEAAEGALGELGRKAAEGRAHEAAARSAREAARREHAALALRRELAAGKPCPVCEQTVARVPAARAVGLEEVDAAAAEAETAASAAVERLQAGRLEVEQSRGRARALARERDQLEAQVEESQSLQAEVEAGLERAGFSEGDRADPARLGGDVERELRALDRAKEARADVEKARQEGERQRAAAEAARATAAAQRDDSRERIETLSAAQETATQRLGEARESLLVLARREGWTGLDPLPAGRDEAQVLESLREERQRVASAAAARVAALREGLASLERALARAAELRERRQALEETAALHRTLSDHLKANELVAWIQEEALSRLAQEGSAHLARLSQGRYSLQLGAGDGAPSSRVEQDFYVVDHWNAQSVRSVKTLSGGETFLASLALALALAEGLAQLSVGGHVGDALESLFLDEGFGTLDAETLDVVVSALDALHGGERVVGIVTHVRELAERLPARLEVRRQGTSATAVVL